MNEELTGTVEHTPTPWTYCKREKVSGIPSKESTIPFAIYKPLSGSCIPIADICSTPYNIHGDKNEITDAAVEEMEANAQFIVTACNSHEALVAVLEGLISEFPAGELNVRWHPSKLKALARAKRVIKELRASLK